MWVLKMWSLWSLVIFVISSDLWQIMMVVASLRPCILGNDPSVSARVCTKAGKKCTRSLRSCQISQWPHSELTVTSPGDDTASTLSQNPLNIVRAMGFVPVWCLLHWYIGWGWRESTGKKQSSTSQLGQTILFWWTLISPGVEQGWFSFLWMHIKVS